MARRMRSWLWSDIVSPLPEGEGIKGVRPSPPSPEGRGGQGVRTSSEGTGSTRIQVVAKASAVTWDKDFARQILDKIVVYSR